MRGATEGGRALEVPLRGDDSNFEDEWGEATSLLRLPAQRGAPGLAESGRSRAADERSGGGRRRSQGRLALLPRFPTTHSRVLEPSKSRIFAGSLQYYDAMRGPSPGSAPVPASDGRAERLGQGRSFVLEPQGSERRGLGLRSLPFTRRRRSRPWLDALHRASSVVCVILVVALGGAVTLIRDGALVRRLLARGTTLVGGEGQRSAPAGEAPRPPGALPAAMDRTGEPLTPAALGAPPERFMGQSPASSTAPRGSSKASALDPEVAIGAAKKPARPRATEHHPHRRVKHKHRVDNPPLEDTALESIPFVP